MIFKNRVNDLIAKSNYISRDLSWIKFNYRVLDQAKKKNRTIAERLKFLAITASNLDEFFMIRVGSLYNYLDYNKRRFDFSGLSEVAFRNTLYEELNEFSMEQNRVFKEELRPYFEDHGFRISGVSALNDEENKLISNYFKKTIFPMLTPMVSDSTHPFPMLMNKFLIFGVITKDETIEKHQRRISFLQVPQNLPRYYPIQRDDEVIFVPIEDIVRANINKLYRNVEIIDLTLFRITRNGDFTIEEDDDLDTGFLEEIKRKLQTRRSGRVVRLEVQNGYSPWLVKILMDQWDIREDNIFVTDDIIDYTSLWQIVKHDVNNIYLPSLPSPVPPLSIYEEQQEDSVFDRYKKSDMLLHHPYNSMEHLLELVEAAADDPKVLAIKITIYRLADDSRIITALHKAAENGKHVSVLFEVKARFDEENNILEGQKLQDAGCFVVYGFNSVKTHTKLLLIVRQEEKGKVRRYVHMSTGNYNESTAKLYTDIGFITTNEVYAHDVSEFFNVITGHSKPQQYEKLVAAPQNMRKQLVKLIESEAENAQKGKPSGIVLKANSLHDPTIIEKLYLASQAGVPIKLIIRGICCLRPCRKGLSENIEVLSLVGDYLEHSRIFYFHNEGNPHVLAGSADPMTRSFDRRIESLFFLDNGAQKDEVINILHYNIKDNVNSYRMNEDGSYSEVKPREGEESFNSHVEFYRVSPKDVQNRLLF